MSEMKEKGTNSVPVEMTDTELDEVVGGVRSQMTENGLWIAWTKGDQMNLIWGIVDGFKSVFDQWGVHTDLVKDAIKRKAKEEIGRNLRYYAGEDGSIVVYNNRTIY